MTLNLSEIIQNISRVVFLQTIKNGIGINQHNATSGESRNFFLPVLRQKPRRAMVKVKKNFVVADKKKQMSLRYPLI